MCQVERVAPQPVAWLLAVAAFAFEHGADAVDDSIPIRLELTAPSGCSSLRELLAAVQRRNGRVRLASDGEPAVSLRITLRADPQGSASGELEVRTKQGDSSARVVTGSSCEAVVEALALTTALSLASYELSPPVGSAARPSQTAVTGAPAPASSRGGDPEAAERSAPTAWKWEAGAQASLGRLVAPHLHAGAGLLGRARWERRGALSPSLTLSVSHARNELFESSRHAGMSLTGVSVSGCPGSLRLGAALRLEACLCGSAGSLRASGKDLPEAASVSRSWWGVGALARVSVSPWSGLSLEVEGGALVPLVERRFVVEPSGRSLGSTPEVAPFVTAGLAHAL